MTRRRPLACGMDADSVAIAGRCPRALYLKTPCLAEAPAGVHSPRAGDGDLTRSRLDSPEHVRRLRNRFSDLPARNRQAGGAAEMGKLIPPYTVNRSIQPEISGRPTAFAPQADAAGMIHLSHTFRPALNYGAFAAVDPLRPRHFLIPVPMRSPFVNLCQPCRPCW